jgi:hypothetical protein
MKQSKWVRVVLACLSAAPLCHMPVVAVAGSQVPQIVGVPAAQVVEVYQDGQQVKIGVGNRVGNWSLMAVVKGGPSGRLAVFEDFSQPKGRLLFLDSKGVQGELPKSLEPTFAEPGTLYRGHTIKEVLNSDHDLLGQELLAQSGDPDYGTVAACFVPISKMEPYTFVGTHGCLEKIGISYGGRTATFDPAVYVPAIQRIRTEGRVLDGLAGGWLPAARFVYPEKPGNWSELIIYAPMRMDNDNARSQPVWYRVCRVEDNVLKWVRYFDSYHPFPPRSEAPASAFYEELLAMRTGWERALAPGMKTDIPDQRLADLARHSLVCAMMTRMGPYPKYGVFDRNYGGSEHDGFQDTFNVDTTAMLEWGLFDLAREYIDNYFTFFVRDDGSILYRGPETGQYGRMLTVLAEYANYTGDHKLLLKHRTRIDAVTRLLLSLRAKALALPHDAPAYGMLAGWSEADACLDPQPSRYMQPYFSNSSEAARGFGDLGAVWEKLGPKTHRPELTAWGQTLQWESRTLAQDMQTAIGRSILTNTEPACLPAIAGVKEPFDAAVPRDSQDPQFRSYRAYMEMLYSGNLTLEQVDMVVKYRAAHRDIVLGVPAAYGYNSHEMGGFLSYGHGYGLLQHDFVREYLLELYSLSAHQYTRGTWTAPETRRVNPTKPAAAYCVPAQLVVPLMVRWMLVFEEPLSQTLWLCKATPRSWLEEGKTVAVSHAPTRWGPASFSLQSHLQQGWIEVKLELPENPAPQETRLRLRAPEGKVIRSVTLAGRPWTRFDPQAETITLPSRAKGKFALTVNYR